MPADSETAPGQDEQPLIGAAVAVLWSAFTITRRDHHRGHLTTLIGERNGKPFPKVQLFDWHDYPRS